MYCEDHFKVLSIKNVPFPSSPWPVGIAATTNASYDKEISEFTLCYRFLIESYNDGYVWLFGAHWKSKTLIKSTLEINFMERIGWKTGKEKGGYQSGLTMLRINIPGGGLSDKQLPIYHNYVLARNIDISKWYHMCISYSSLLKTIHMFQDGLRIYASEYGDEVEEPLP